MKAVSSWAATAQSKARREGMRWFGLLNRFSLPQPQTPTAISNPKQGPGPAENKEGFSLEASRSHCLSDFNTAIIKRFPAARRCPFFPLLPLQDDTRDLFPAQKAAPTVPRSHLSVLESPSQVTPFQTANSRSHRSNLGLPYSEI